MSLSVWFFICSGLFLGWSLGANHAVNVFGTAVTSRMLKFKTAALIGGIFAVLGAILSGGGTTETLNNLGGINAIAGSFTVALAVGISITWMTKAKLPVSTSQAVIGAIIGWNLFTGTPTDLSSLFKIFISWVISPVIAGIFAFLIFVLIKKTILKQRIHLLLLDNYTRTGLIVVGALASYSLGANNIANVMGMFVSASGFEDILTPYFTISGTQQLFFLGGVSIAAGMMTYGEKVMATVGKDLYKISPITGFTIVLAEFLVLTMFTSKELESVLISLNLPTIPLVPLSTTQAFIGAVIGVGLAKDPASINFRVFRKITLGWVLAPLIAGIISFVSLFFVQNVFEQKVINPVPYRISDSVLDKLKSDGVPTQSILDMKGIEFDNKKTFRNELLERYDYNNSQLFILFKYAIVDSFYIDTLKLSNDIKAELTAAQFEKIKSLQNRSFSYKHEFEKSLFHRDSIWNDTRNRFSEKETKGRKNKLEQIFRINTF